MNKKTSNKQPTTHNKIRILAIESSCDETSAAVVEVTLTAKSYKLKAINILSNIVSSQIKLHAKYGGVYPELASREHVKNILPVTEESITGISNYQFPISNKMSKSKFQIPNEVQNLKSEINHKSAICNLKSEIDYIAVTTGPGLIGSLLVGVETAKTLAYVFNKPIVPVNHLEGHIYANFIGENSKSQILNSKQIQNPNVQNSKKLQATPVVEQSSLRGKASYKLPEFPLMVLIVSGGHTSLVYMNNHLDYKIIGETLDDAAGEAFDKVATMLGLEYPGGPEIEALASKFPISNFQFPNNSQNSNDQNPKKLFNFPRPMINSKDFNFSFSGLKTAVLYAVKKLPKPLSPKTKALICSEFQDAVVETLVAKTFRAAEEYKVKSILLGGGVAANSRLREEFELRIKNYELYGKTSNSEKLHVTRYTLQDFFVPEKSLCTDNAAVIGAAAAYKILAGKISRWNKIQANANLEL